MSGARAAWSIAGALVLALGACGGSPKSDAADPSPAPPVKSAEERHAERTETAIYGLCTTLTRCAVLQGEAMADQLSEQDRAALTDKRVLDANTSACVDAQMAKSELSQRQVDVIEGCVEDFAAEITLDQCQEAFPECLADAAKQ